MKQQSQPAAQELSDERILHVWDTHVGSVSETCPLTDRDKLAFARAVLRLQQQAQEGLQASAPAQSPTPAPIASPATTQPAQNVVAIQPRPTPAPAGPPTLRIGGINERLARCKVTEADLIAMGIQPAARERGWPVFHEHQFPAIVAALIAHLAGVQKQQEAAA